MPFRVPQFSRPKRGCWIDLNLIDAAVRSRSDFVDWPKCQLAMVRSSNVGRTVQITTMNASLRSLS